MEWLVFLIGTLLYFLIKFVKRADKTKEPSLLFWWKDNWPELLLSFGFDFLAMIILCNSETNITVFLAKLVPEGIVLPTKLMIGAACGLGIGGGIYELIAGKLQKIKEAKLNETT
jgi:Fe-S oxidoreductase